MSIQPIPANNVNRSTRREQMRQARRTSRNKAVWNDITDLAERIRNALDVQPAIIFTFFAKEALRPFIPADHLQATDDGLELLRNDHQIFSELFNEIAKAHAGRTGKAMNDDDFHKSTDVYGRYIDLLNRYESTCVANINFLMSVMSATEDAVYVAQEKLKTKGVVFANNGTELVSAPEGVTTADEPAAQQEAANV